MSEAVPERGEGVPQDDAEAVNWHLKAAEQGRALAQVSLGEMYKRGNGVPQDYVEAVAWYRRAAEQGHALAQFYLGVSYERGEGVLQDTVQAHMWFNLAASRATIQQLRALDDAGGPERSAAPGSGVARGAPGPLTTTWLR